MTDEWLANAGDAGQEPLLTPTQVSLSGPCPCRRGPFSILEYKGGAAQCAACWTVFTKHPGLAAAVALIAILGLVTAQMVARWTGLIFPGGAQYAGYAMAATSFLAMAYTFNHNAHIRVALFVTKSGRYRRAVELWCYTLASLAAVFLAWYAVKAMLLSAKINDISQGQDATPLWIPQTLDGGWGGDLCGGGG